MTDDIFARERRLLGGEATERLAAATVAVFGLGGVGSWAAEALARGGIGRLVLVDADRVAPSNINRQLAALHSTVGRYKTDVLRERFMDINPAAVINARPVFYGADTADSFDMAGWDYIIDAVDTVTAKLLLAERAAAANVPLISSMGTGNKLDPARLEVADIYDTSVCPLAAVMRRELRRRGIGALKVVYSRETPRTPRGGEEQDYTAAGRPAVGSVSFVPPVAGLLLAGEVIRDIGMVYSQTS